MQRSVSIVGLGNWGSSLAHALVVAGVSLQEVIVPSERSAVGYPPWTRTLPLTTLDRAGRAAHRRTAIAYVGQQAGLVPHLSALENVEVALTLRGVEDPGGLAFSTLEAVGLAERARQRVSRLSQGERARVAIARAAASLAMPHGGHAGSAGVAVGFAARPKLLLADEPTSRLDGANAIAVAHLLARLARDTGAAVLCATHDPLVIEQADNELKLI